VYLYISCFIFLATLCVTQWFYYLYYAAYTDTIFSLSSPPRTYIHTYSIRIVTILSIVRLRFVSWILHIKPNWTELKCDRSISFCDFVHASSFALRARKCTYVCVCLLEMKVYHLWEFIHELLDVSEMQQQASYTGFSPHEMAPVRWESKDQLVFRIVDSKRMAKLWGQHKNNSTMTYEKLSRSLR